MIVLQQLFSLALLAGAILGVTVLNRKIISATGYNPLTKGKFLCFFAGAVLLLLGKGLLFDWHEWHSWDNGLVLMLIGAAFMAGLARENFRRAGLRYGACATAMHVVLFGEATLVGFVLVPIFLIGSLWLLTRAQPVIVINR